MKKNIFFKTPSNDLSNTDFRVFRFSLQNLHPFPMIRGKLYDLFNQYYLTSAVLLDALLRRRASDWRLMGTYEYMLVKFEIIKTGNYYQLKYHNQVTLKL